MHWNLLKKSALQILRSPSLVMLVLLEMLLLFVLSVPFLMLQAPALMLVYYALFLFVNAFFKSGIAAMCKNAVIDGSTTLREFLPGARRYWGRFLLLFLVIGAAFFLVGLPLLFVYHPLLLALSLLTSLVIMALLLWAMQEIVFEDASFIGAIARSSRIAIKEAARTIVVLLVVIAVFFASGLFSYLLDIPYQAMLPEIPQQLSAGIIVWGVALELLIALISSIALAFSFLYTFHAYRAMRERHVSRR